MVGRFINEDTIGFYGEDLNLYAYVTNSPTNWIDPEGDSRDTYVPDYSGKHGGPHVDRYNPAGQNVGRYDENGNALSHKGIPSPPVPNSDQDKFKDALDKLKKKKPKQCDSSNAPNLPWWWPYYPFKGPFWDRVRDWQSDVEYDLTHPSRPGYPMAPGPPQPFPVTPPLVPLAP